MKIQDSLNLTKSQKRAISLLDSNEIKAVMDCTHSSRLAVVMKIKSGFTYTHHIGKRGGLYESSCPSDKRNGWTEDTKKFIRTGVWG